MTSNPRIVIGVLAIAASPTVAFAGRTTIDSGYAVDPCYKRCAPLLSSVSPRQEAKRVFDNCFAYCSHKGLISCPGGVFVPRSRACP